MLLSPLVEQAAELAAQWHDATYRKGCWRDPAFDVPPEVALQVPVMAHVTTVAFILQRAGWDDATIAAAFLHDILEDGNCRGEHFPYARLAAVMGAQVADRVQGVSEPKYDTNGEPLPWQARKVAYVERLAGESVEAVAISLADKLHNLWSMNQALDAGVDIFTPAPGRRALSAGPDRQRWFYRAVLDATAAHTDPRLDTLRAQLHAEFARFERLVERLEDAA